MPIKSTSTTAALIPETQEPTDRFKLAISGSSLVLAYAIIILFISMSDAIMSYVVPNYMQVRLNDSATSMGLIIASSSIFGIIADFLVGKWFRGRRFGFFLKWTLIIGILFPIILIIFPSTALYFVIAMAVWGVYYELISFSITQFISEFTKTNEHANAWGIILSLRSLSYAIGPILAELLIASNEGLAFYMSAGFIVVAAIGYLFLATSPRVRKRLRHNPNPIIPKTSVWQEFRLWGKLSSVLWHLLAFSFISSLIDAFFWTTGTILSQQISERGAPPGILLFLVSVPSLFVGLFVGSVVRKLGGQKRTAFISQFISSVLLIIAGLTTSDPLLLLLVFISSIFGAISLPALNGAFTDYASRLPQAGNELIGLTSATVGLSSIVGPIIAGIVADAFGNQQSFVVFGSLAAIISIFALFTVPRKVRMPQSEISEIIEMDLADKYPVDQAA